MEAASSSTCVVMKEERIDGEDEEASGKKETCQGEGQEIAKKAAKKTAKMTAKKQTAKAAPKKKISAPPAPSKPTAVKKAVPDEETRKIPSSKGIPAMPKEPELDEEEVGEEEIDLSGEGEIDEDVEEDLSLDDEEEDVDYIEKSDDLVDDSEDYRH